MDCWWLLCPGLGSLLGRWCSVSPEPWHPWRKCRIARHGLIVLMMMMMMMMMMMLLLLLLMLMLLLLLSIIYFTVLFWYFLNITSIISWNDDSTITDTFTIMFIVTSMYGHDKMFLMISPSCSWYWGKNYNPLLLTICFEMFRVPILTRPARQSANDENRWG